VIAPEDPPGFIVRTEAQKAAFDNGFRIERGVENGWLRYASATANGEIWVAGASSRGPWFLSLSHSGVAAETTSETTGLGGPGVKTLELSNLAALYAAIARVYQLGVSLPDAPLQAFRKMTAALPRTTETERLTVLRIGQDVFRKSLLAYWNNRCPMTGVTEPSLLRASHIVPWAATTTRNASMSTMDCCSGRSGMQRSMPGRSVSPRRGSRYFILTSARLSAVSCAPMQLFASRVSRRSICQTLPGTINAQDCEARNDAPPSSFGSCTTRTVRAGALAGPPFHETETGARKNAGD
jgi:hypothetical protein